MIFWSLKYFYSIFSIKNEKDESQDLATNQNDDSSRKLNEITITKEEPIGVPHIIIENVHKFDLDEFLKNPKFPPIEEV